MHVIILNSEKGGTGKSTLAAHGAALLANMGLRVLLVDTDPQASATLSFGVEPHPALYRLLVDEAEIADVVTRPAVERYALPDSTPKGELMLIGNSRHGHGIPHVIQDELLLRERLDEVRDWFDVAVIDTAPSPGLMLALAYYASDWLIVPSQMEFLSLAGVAATIRSAEKRQIKLMGIVPTHFRKQTQLHQHHYTELCEQAAANGWHVFEPVDQAIVWAEASTMRCMVYSLAGEVGKARIQAVAFARQIMEHLTVFDGGDNHANRK